MNKKLIITALLALLASTCCIAKEKKSVLNDKLRGYPSGAIDQYHFHAGKAVIQGRFVNTEQDFSTFNVTGTDQFSNQDFVRTINIEPDGSFLELISLPHSGWVYFDGADIPPAFIAVGDTLEIQINSSKEENVTISGSGVTGEVNSIWPRLETQFASKETRTPWEGLNRSFMLEWKNRKVKELDQIARAIDADTIALLKDCSNYAKDVLKTSLLAMPLEHILVAAHQWMWRTRSEDGKVNPDQAIPASTFFDFLAARQSYLLDNPLMVFAADGGGVINNMEFSVLNAYLFLANNMERWSKSTDSDELGNYIDNFVLPHDYDPVLHREMLEYDKGHLISAAEYYAMCSDSIRARFQLDHTGFMMQLCLLHRVLDFDYEGSPDFFLTRKAEELAGAMPQFTDRAICHHAVDAYRRFVIEREGSAQMSSSTSTPGDSLFQSLKEKYAGNVIYMDFWGIGCGPCRKGILDQRTLVEKYKDAPVRFLYICNEKDSPREPSEKFLSDNHIQGEHIFLSSDEWNHLTNKFQFNAIPFTLLLDKKGNIVEKNVPPTAGIIDELLK